MVNKSTLKFKTMIKLNQIQRGGYAENQIKLSTRLQEHDTDIEKFYH